MLHHNFYPNKLGFYFPAEWETHNGTWLSWPHNNNTWLGYISNIYKSYIKFIELLSWSENVYLNIKKNDLNFILKSLKSYDINYNNLYLIYNNTDDAWIRDYGPSFLKNHNPLIKNIIINWNFNAWGQKYDNYENDNYISVKIAKKFNFKLFNTGIIMEGGSIDVNGKGKLITTQSCLLNKNRNPNLNKYEISDLLKRYYNVNDIIWLNEGIVGDDTDGHVDDIARFVNDNTILIAYETNINDKNHYILDQNFKILQQYNTLNDNYLNIIKLPMPKAIYYKNIRLPASYLNFYICNKYVIVPTFNCSNDRVALDIISEFFPTREVIGINSENIIIGLGSFHCLSQQQPA